MVRTLIKGGYVIDPANNRQENLDVLISGSKINKIAPHITTSGEDEVIDASGLIVCPGLIDLHTHCYQYATPLGVNPDETCLKKGKIVKFITLDSCDHFLSCMKFYCLNPKMLRNES